MKIRDAALTATLVTAIAVFIVVFIQNFRTAEKDATASQFDLIGKQVAEQIAHEVDLHLQALGALTRAIDYGAIKTPSDFEFFANEIHRQYPAFVAINRMDASRVINVVTPYEGNQAALGRTVGDTPDIVGLVEGARETGIPVATHLVRLFQGGLGVATYFPVSIGGSFDGYVNGVIAMTEVLEEIVQRIDPSIRIVLGEEKEAIAGEAESSWYSYQSPISVLNRNWHALIFPDPTAHNKWSAPSRLVELYGFLFGLLCIALVVQLVFLRRRALQESDQRSNAEKELRQREAFVRSIADNLPVSISYIDRARTFRFVNRTAAAWNNLSSAQMLGRRFDDFPMLDESSERGAVATALPKQTTRSMHHVKYPDGVARWIDLSLVPDLDDAGDLRGYFRLAVDITDRKQAEAESLQSRLRLQATLDATVDGIVTIDQDGLIVIANGAITRLFGYSPEELVGQNVRILMPEPYRSEHDSYIGNYHRSGISKIIGFGREVQARRKDGSVFDIDLAVAELPPEANGGRFIGTLRDIGRRKKVEKALLAQREMLDEIVNNSPTMIWVYDSHMRLSLANDQIASWFGRPKESLIGKTPFDLFDYDVASVLNGRNLEVFEEGIRTVGEITVPKPLRREQRILRITRFPLKNAENEIEGVVCVGVDVTDEKQAEERLRQAQRMEAVGQLTGGVAHDFNNLLAVILGNLQLLERRGLNEDTHARLLVPALRATKRGAELTRQLLAFGRRLALRAVPTQLADLLPGLRDMLGRTLGETISWEWYFGTDLAQCFVDPAQLEAAILNLAINARDAMPDGGKIFVGVHNKTIDHDFAVENPEVGEGKYIAISVTDEGHGMSPEVLDKVFEPFYTTKDVGKGSGLGLSMVYGFVKQSGGHVTIDSAPDVGTTVTLYLPQVATGSERTTNEEGKKPIAETFSGTVLIVEDQDDVRTTAIAQLEDLGFDVLDATSGAEALSILLIHDGAIDLLFSDVVLGGNMSGPDLVEEAKQIHPKIKVIYVSGYAESMRGGVRNPEQDAYLLDKPYSREQLVDAVKKALGSTSA